jgi:antibiotic biosynthesis monooxygenase (ABM) superfamily enzyme
MERARPDVAAMLGPPMQSWPLPLRALLVSVVMVIALTRLVLPFLMWAFGSWMSRSN